MAVDGQVPLNDDCENAMIIDCGDFVSGTTLEASGNSENTQCFGYSTNPSVWYQIEPTGQVNVLSFISSSEGSIRIEIAQNSCIPQGGADCRSSFYLYSIEDSIRINSEIGTTLYLKIESGCCGRSGDFEFSFTCEDSAINDLCSNATVIECNGEIELNLSTASSDHYNRVCEDEVRPDLWYSIEGDDMIHVIEGPADFYDYLELDIYEGDCDSRFSNCPIDQYEIDNNNTTSSFIANTGSSYLLRFYSYPNIRDSIILDHYCMLPSTNDLCENSINIVCSESIIGNTTFASHSDEYNGCHSEYANDLWYTVTGDDMLHVFRADSLEKDYIRFDIYEGFCGTEISVCTNSFGLSDDSKDFFFAEAGKTYLIRISASHSDLGYFSISHLCMNPLSNDDCEQPETITCGDSIQGNTTYATPTNSQYPCDYFSDDPDLWFTISGDDQIHTFLVDSLEFSRLNFEIIEGTCETNNGNCFDEFQFQNGKIFSMYAESGKTYLIRVYWRYSYNKGYFNISHECLDPLPNDNCDSPLQINCGEQLIGSAAYATHSNQYNGCSFENKNDVWYSVLGDDMIHNFSLAEGQNQQVELSIFSESCDKEFKKCREELILYESGSAYNFFAKSGESYLIRIVSGCCGTYHPFEINHQCFSQLENDYCLTASEVSCGEQVNVELSNASPSNTSTCASNGANDLWFELSGSGQLIFFEAAVENNQARIEVYEMICRGQIDECPKRLSFFYGQNSFLSDSSKTYIVRIFGSNYFTEDFTFQLACFDLESNDSCENAREILCSENIIGNTSLATNSVFYNGCSDRGNKDLWFKITGDGNIHSFIFEDGDIEDLAIQFTINECGVSTEDCLFHNFGSYNSSELRLLLQDGIEYNIVITGWSHNDEGSFIINHDCIDTAQNDACDNSLEINCGDVITGNTESASNSMDFTGCISTQSPDLWFNFVGDGNIRLFEFIDSESGCISIDIFDTDCPIYGENCIVGRSMDDSRESFAFTTQVGIHYQVRITTCGNQRGQFNLAFNCFELPENDLCENAIELICGNSILGNTAIASHTSEFNGCISEQHKDLWYTIEGDGQVHVFEQVLSEVNNLHMDIYQNECGNFSLCNTEIRLSSRNHSFLAQSGTLYYVRIYHRSSQGHFGSFEINHICAEPPENDNCENAIIIACNTTEIHADLNFASAVQNIDLCGDQSDKDIWYTLLGDDLLHTFFYLDSDGDISIQIYEAGCGEDLSSCLTSRSLGLGQSPMSFIAEQGHTYLIRMFSNSYYPTTEFSLLHMCMDPIPNDVCQNPERLECGQNFFGDTKFATSRNLYNGCEYEYSNDLWYLIEGNDDYHYFSLAETQYNFVKMEIMEQGCSIPLENCLESYYFDVGEKERFFAEKGQDFLLRIYSTDYNFNLGGYFEFEHSCFPISQNDSCSNATSISCGDIVNGDTKSASFSSETNTCAYGRYNDLWYSIIGDGQIHTFDLLQIETDRMTISLFEAQCDSTICISNWNISLYNTHTSFQTEANKNYLIRIANACCGPDGAFELEYNCTSPVINNDCENAMYLNCGEALEGSLQNSSALGFETECSDERRNDVWYRIKGDNQAHIFSPVNQQESAILLEYYESNCESRFDTCSYELFDYNNQGAKFFIAETGKDYIVRVFSNFLIDFNFSHDCQAIEEFSSPVPSNDFCQDAIELFCGDIIFEDLAFATEDQDHIRCGHTYTNSTGVWYTFAGDGSILTIDDSNSDVGLIIYIYEGTCDNTECTDNMYQYYNSQPVTVQTVAGVDYYILVRSSSTFYTDIRFDVACDDTPPNDLCENPTSIDCGSNHSINFDFASYTFAYNGCDFESENDVWYTFTGNDEYIIITSQASGYYSIELNIYSGLCGDFNGNCVTDIYLGSSRNQGAFFAELGEDYLIRLSDAYQNSPVVNLGFDCTHASINDDCIYAENIVCDSIISGNLLASSPSVDLNTCSSNNSHDLWYTLQGDGQVHGFSSQIYNNSDLKMDFYDKSCGDPLLNCLQSIVINNGLPSSNFQTQTGVTYLIRLYADNQNAIGDFSIQHYCGPSIENDDCLNAVQLMCRDTIYDNMEFSTVSMVSNENCKQSLGDVWFTIQGDSMFHTFSNLYYIYSDLYFTIYDSSCDELISEDCIDQFVLNRSNQEYSFFANPLNQYFISLSTNDYHSNYNFIYNCVEAPGNDICTSAQPLMCSDTIVGNTLYANADSRQSGCDYDEERDLWYTFQGDDNFHAFEFLYSDSESISFEFYEGMCDSYHQNCTHSFLLNDKNFSTSIFAETGRQYLLKVTLGCCDENGEFSFYHSCPQSPENDQCDNAIELSCDTSININLQAATYSPIYSDCHSSENGDLWYKLNGNNQVITLSIDSLFDTNTNIDVYTETCTNKYTCYSQLEFSGESVNQGFFADQGTVYFLRVHTDNGLLKPSFNISIRCEELAINSNCKTALSINCGNTILGSTIGLDNKQNDNICYSQYEGAPVLWYKIHGNNTVQNIHIESQDMSLYINLFTNNCDELNCYYPSSYLSYQGVADLSFPTVQDSLYYLMVSSKNNKKTGQFSININCESIPGNNNLENAISIHCGEITIGTIVNASKNDLLDNCNQAIDPANGVWYKYDSFGESLDLEFTTLGFQPEVSLYEHSDDDSIICVEQKSIETSGLSINECELSSLPSFNIPCIQTDADTICVPIHAKNTEDLFSIEFSITYDTSYLVFIGTNINFFGGTGTSNDLANEQLNIDWDGPSGQNQMIDETSDYFVELCFTRNTTEAFQAIDFDFTGNIRLQTRNAIGFQNIVDGCFSPGILLDQSENLACDQNEQISFKTEPDKSYYIFIEGSNSYDSGDFEFATNCEIINTIAEIPTLSEWALICLMLIMMILGITSIKQHTIEVKQDELR